MVFRFNRGSKTFSHNLASKTLSIWIYLDLNQIYSIQPYGHFIFLEN
ncbi:hypothetical protein CKA32_000191 [Geitlerinema sp. FC II]|nr:hypothetical protein CKA32_000191 [Geitlerinema sp. FC II]